MKPDTTSENSILSRKIRMLQTKIFFLLVMASGPFIQPSISVGESLTIDFKNLKSIPPDNLIIIDTRSKIKYLLGHIPKAIHLGKWQDFTQEVKGVRGLLIKRPNFIVNKFNSYGIHPKKNIVIYGDPDDPWRTDGRFFWMFERLGFNKVTIYEGGLKNWKKSGEKLEFGRGQALAKSLLTTKDIRLNDEVSAEQQWILERLDSKTLAIIDNRTRDEYLGAMPYGSPRGGHIPNAVHIHWPDFFLPSGYMKNKTELLNILTKFNITYEKEVVVYCTGGVRSAMAYFVLRHLGFKVRNYDGSWWDWSQNPNLPIELS
jgi:thiosulfate/3-mercaptopyruvate sulfurtransferase